MQQTLSDDGTIVHYEVRGTSAGAPLLVIPGGPCRGPEYLGDLAGLSEIRPLSILHPRGTDATGGLSRGWWSDAADLIAVADALGLTDFDVLAHSAGTRLALAAAARFPGRLASLTLVTPAAAWLTDTEHDGATVASRRDEPEIRAALHSMALGPENEDEFQLAWDREAPAGYARWGAAERSHALLGRMSLAAATAWFNGIPSDAVEQIMSAQLPPTTVIGGEEDILSGVETVKAYAAALGSGVRMIPGCGHYPWVEQPREFLACLDVAGL